MDIDALKTIVLVARHGSFSAAARILDLDPSSVSRIVAGVEHALGLRLFQRSTRRLSVTEEGAVYIARVAPLIDDIEKAADDARQLRELPSGTLKMTASVAFAYECVTPYLRAFHETYPNVTVELWPTDANVDVLANNIDLAIRLASAPEGELISTRLLATRYRVCASPQYLDRHGPIGAPQALVDHDCLRFALPDFRSQWKFRKDDKVISVAITGTTLISNALSLRRAAREGLGPVLLPDWLVRHDVRQGILIDLFPDHDCTATTFDTGAWALYPSREFLPRKVRSMIDFLRVKLRQAS